MALEIRHIEINASSSASTVSLPKTRAITHLLAYATAFLGRNFHVTQRKSSALEKHAIARVPRQDCARSIFLEVFSRVMHHGSSERVVYLVN